MYDEHINCNLKPSALMEDRLLNWNRINGKYSKDRQEPSKGIHYK